MTDSDSSKGQFYHPLRVVDRTRHQLPHWHQEDTWSFVTWRLADALPSEKLTQWRLEKERWRIIHPEPWDAKTEEEYHHRFTQQIQDWLDQGSGSCVLRNPEYAAIVANSLLHFDQQRYKLASFVVMPNHVHVLFAPIEGFMLQEILHSWKRHSAREINKLSGKTGRLWQEDYWDRLVRNEKHFRKVDEYIRENAVKAGLKEGEYVLWK